MDRSLTCLSAKLANRNIDIVGHYFAILLPSLPLKALLVVLFVLELTIHNLRAPLASLGKTFAIKTTTERIRVSGRISIISGHTIHNFKGCVQIA